VRVLVAGGGVAALGTVLGFGSWRSPYGDRSGRSEQRLPRLRAPSRPRDGPGGRIDNRAAHAGRSRHATCPPRAGAAADRVGGRGGLLLRRDAGRHHRRQRAAGSRRRHGGMPHSAAQWPPCRISPRRLLPAGTSAFRAPGLWARRWPMPRRTSRRPRQRISSAACRLVSWPMATPGSVTSWSSTTPGESSASWRWSASSPPTPGRPWPRSWTKARPSYDPGPTLRRRRGRWSATATRRSPSRTPTAASRASCGPSACLAACWRPTTRTSPGSAAISQARDGREARPRSPSPGGCGTAALAPARPARRHGVRHAGVVLASALGGRRIAIRVAAGLAAVLATAGCAWMFV
jgi:hypothetical protein